ncbi:MAG TPA: 16S rRNA (adenine(1518)-N(6)/adenine(1519)-N(6))-dimethyltransferase RsmA [Blastocatellia bacterium]|nr:16S rRNA (adenine(1518)-N(6)/adenine(1519)-N(6))-dimethyltransferase RsmA [Blastocatellia bacterium]
MIILIKAKKSLGQNFLTDRGVARRIVDAVAPLPKDIVIEIGPGTGALTRMLAERCGKVVAVEIDARLVDELRSKFKAENLSILNADALSVDWDEMIAEAISSSRVGRGSNPDEGRVRIVANLPYFISTPIIERLLSLGRQLFDMTLMLQKEVADRITTGPGSKEYGYLSVMVQYHCDALKLFEVPPSAFTPAPKVRSAVIRLTVREQPRVEVADEKKFFAFVRAAFAQRRKTILNNLKAAARALEFTSGVESAVEATSVSPQRRAETLSLTEFAALYQALYRRL